MSETSSDAEGIAIALPPGTTCHYSVRIERDHPQRIELVAATGTPVFVLTQDGRGSFMVPSDGSDPSFRMRISNDVDGKSLPAHVIWDREEIGRDGETLYTCLTFLADDAEGGGDFTASRTQIYFYRGRRSAVTFDIVIVIDAGLILADGPGGNDPDTPAPVTGDAIRVVSQNMDQQDQTGGRIRIAAPVGAQFRFREMTPSAGDARSVLFYSFGAVPGRADTVLITTPEPVIQPAILEPVPDQQDPTRPKPEKTKAFYWKSRILQAGEAAYPMRFAIIGADGEILGYYAWTPTLVVTGKRA